MSQIPSNLSKELYIPLNFWFNSNKYDPHEEFAKLLETNSQFAECFNKTLFLLYPQILKYHTNDTTQDLLKLYESLDYMNSMIRNQGITSKSYFTPLYEKLWDLLKENDVDEYYCNLIMTKNDIANGYNLFEAKEPIMRYDIFIGFRDMLLNDEYKNITYDKFISKFEKCMCSEWHKCNRYGEYYTGFYEYPEGSIEKENAWQLTYEDNCKSLWELPYPKKLVLKCIKYLCNNHGHGANHINMMCEWIKRKHQQMVDMKTKKLIHKEELINNTQNLNGILELNIEI